MPQYGYGYQVKEGEDLAKAQLYNIDASFKDMSAVCDNIRGMDSEVAVSYLEKAAKGELAVAFRRWNKKLGHRRELGGKKGRYPKKAAKYVLQVLRNAIANGSSKGLGGMQIVHASSTRQAVYPRMASKGRQMRSNYVTSRVEIVLKATGKVSLPKKEGKKAVGEAKKEPVKETKAAKVEKVTKVEKKEEIKKEEEK